MPTQGMPTQWWDARTLTNGTVTFDDPERMMWIRYRLADEINRRFWRSQGIRVLWVMFEPLAGDQYSHPVVRTGCRLGPVTFGRLSGTRIALDTAAFDEEFSWAGQVDEGEFAFEGLVFRSWEEYLQAALRATGLDRLDTTGHETCGHAEPGFDFTVLSLLATLVRTRLGGPVESSGRWMAERTLNAVEGIGTAIDCLASVHPANQDLLSGDVQGIAIVESYADNHVLMLRHDGLAVTPEGSIELWSAVDAQATPPGQATAGLLEVADRLQRAMTSTQPPGGWASFVSPVTAPVDQLPHGGLPLNRKERFYTGTVLPALITAEDFRHLGRFTDLAGLGDITVSPDPLAADFQLVTEYSLGESALSLDDKSRFGSLPTKEAPDLVLWLPNARALLAVEAKMFHCPGPDQVAEQLEVQRQLMERMASGLHPTPEVSRQVFLVVAPYLDTIASGLPPDVIPVTWEDVHHRYLDVASPYWSAVLQAALTQWPSLRSTTWGPGTKYDLKLTGAEIEVMAEAGDLDGWYIGRRGGLTVALDDVQGGVWKTRRYPLRETPVDKKDWFALIHLLGRM